MIVRKSQEGFPKTFPAISNSGHIGRIENKDQSSVAGTETPLPGTMIKLHSAENSRSPEQQIGYQLLE
jgi:hypothetical protein